MIHRSRSLTDFLLLRAWIEPDHEHPLRVLIRQRGREPHGVQHEQAFADEENAAAYVHHWLSGLVERWESGERAGRYRLAGDEQGRGPDERQKG